MGMQADGLYEPWRGSARRLALHVGCGLLIAAAVFARQAHASEGGVSFYLLGSGGPGAAIMPPDKGVYFDNTMFYYNGTASRNQDFEDSGNVVAGETLNVGINYGSVTWQPTTNLLGGTLAVGAILPIGEPSVTVSEVLTGPLGRQLSRSRSDSAFLVGDPMGKVALGWKQGDFHLQAVSLVNVPIGQYRDGELANLSFHRWAGDFSLAGTWRNDRSGWDVSAKAGVTVNGENGFTDYLTGTESHYEASVEKTITPAFALGVQSYYFFQVTGDLGSGNRVGHFEGRVGAVGGTAAYSFEMGKIPASLRLQVFHEFDAVNRLEGTSAFLKLSFPLSVNRPTAPSTHD